MIRDFKAQIFCRENNLSKKEIDTGDQVWIDRIDEFFRRTSILPPDGDPTEYAAAFEAVYPQPRHRRQYIDDAISKGTPSFGHKVLGSLIAGQTVDCVFTTNFDPLVEESATSANALLPVTEQARPIVAAIDSAERAMRCLNESDWPLVAKLHGDYQSVSIKNTGSELEKQDEKMRHVLVEASKRFGMVFVGYSGRDASVMEALSAVLQEKSPFPNGLYWVASSASRLLPAVTQFLEAAQRAGVDVAVVECKTFDELAADVIKAVELPTVLVDHVMQGRAAARLVPVNLPSREARPFPVLRYSALLIDSLPRTARKIALSQTTTSAAARALLKEKRCRAVVAANGRELAAFGNDEEILAALAPLGARTAGTLELDGAKDSWALGLLYDALVKALSRRRPLLARFKHAGHSLVVAAPREGEDQEKARNRQSALRQLREAYKSALTGSVPQLGFPYQEGVFLKLEQIEGRWWCGFEPYTFVDVPRVAEGEKAGEIQPPHDADDLVGLPMGRRGGDPAGDWRRERWAQKYNRQWGDIIDGWAQLLTNTQDGSVSAFELNDREGVDAVFRISRVTGWSRPGHHHRYFDRRK
ncbi:Sir2-family regulator [Agrobacterium sp. TS43]|uniref:SIR2 family protein n=1 Tax=Agrobacterium TaxID=357 RepID=UPI000381A9E0|nr:MULTISPECIES: SIR2 family protein [Agrobacterium]EPR21204.1 Sir2-family regulator [Agrobacterium radiobacter DSM 30147]KDR89830.1 Sir2-family regulator [Agrobacterium tumefaciens GW4]KVK49855.1 Sir2-family regulator [Agrobacterium sp. JL28]KVK50147.1 Sir2-family regulator [Agrobacterium sp. LY4]KVK59190.1 Sir2-family regulator [Agrobacterium sp. TS43]